MEQRRAAIWQIERASGVKRLFATGLRNPNGQPEPHSGALWTAVNERDELGSDLVPDYITSVKALFMAGLTATASMSTCGAAAKA